MPRKKPIHLAFSYDEEVGCAGAPYMLADLHERGIRPEGCVVGEPTGMQVVVAHKGINLFRCKVHGKAAHSSLTPRGCNAIEYAARLICRIRDLADSFKANGPYDQFYDVPFSTMTTNQIRGGIAVNTIPELCEFTYEFRNLPGMRPDDIQAEVERYVREELLPRMQAEFDGARIEIETGAAAPALEASEQAAITQLVRALTEDRVTRKVAYGTEAGLFQGIGIPTVVCGPGHIEQAHKPNEYVAWTSSRPAKPSCAAWASPLTAAGARPRRPPGPGSGKMTGCKPVGDRHWPVAAPGRSLVKPTIFRCQGPFRPLWRRFRGGNADARARRAARRL